MKIWIPVNYDAYFDLDEWAEEIKDIPFLKDTFDPIETFIQAKADKFEEQEAYDLLVAIETDKDHRLYELFKKTIEEKGIEFQWI